MTENKRETPPRQAKPPGTEERGIVTDVVVPIVAAGVGGVAAGAAEAVVSNHLQNRPSEPPAPSIELPPGVDGD